MFTGIIQAIGEIHTLEPRGGDVRLTSSTGKLDMTGVVPGDSIAVNGVCLTAVLVIWLPTLQRGSRSRRSSVD